MHASGQCLPGGFPGRLPAPTKQIQTEEKAPGPKKKGDTSVMEACAESSPRVGHTPSLSNLMQKKKKRILLPPPPPCVA